MSNLATLGQVKKRLGIATEDVVDDDLLTSFIAGVSARAERECNRKFEYMAWTEEFGGDQCELPVERFPIDETQAITFAVGSAFATGFVTQSNIDCLVRKGCVISLNGQLATVREKIRVSYTGGYALPIDTSGGGVDFEAIGPHLPDDLNLAVIQQVAWFYQNKNRLGVSNISQQGGSLTIADRDLLQDVAAVFKRFERWVN